MVFVTVIGWVVLIIGIIFWVIASILANATDHTKEEFSFFIVNKLWFKVATAVGTVLALLGMFNPFVVVGAGERGVVLDFGAVQPYLLNEGLHLRIPIMQEVVLMDVKVQKAQGSATAASKDLQDSTLTLALNYHADPSAVNNIYQKLGVEYNARIIEPAMHEVVKAVTAKYTAVELITQREIVRQKATEQLRARLAQYNIIVDEFSIVNFKFSKVFSDAIEAKQQAEQLALKAQRDLERIKIESEQKIAQAKAEAESLRLQKQEITPELLRLREIEMKTKAIEKWNGALPNVTGGAVPFIDVGK